MAYQVVIVEDNQNTVRALQTSVDWQAYGFYLAGVAYDGLQGCRLIEQIRPDLVLTDIRMPGADGFTLIEQERDLLAHTRVIVITAYDKFQYATQAIRLSVFDFILKPIDDEELYHSLRRAKRSLDEERCPDDHTRRIEWLRRRTRMIGQLTTLPSADPEDARPVFCPPDLAAYCFLAVGTQESISQPMLQRIDFEPYPPSLYILSVMLGSDLILFCGFRAPDPDWKGTVAELARRLRHHIADVYCAVSGLYTDLTQFRAACREAQQTLLTCEVTNDRAVVNFSPGGQQEEKRPHIADVQALSQKLADADLGAEEAWAALVEGAGGQMRYLRMMLMMYCTKVLQKRLANARIADTVDAAVYDIPQISTTEGAREWFFYFCRELAAAEKNNNCTSVLIRNVQSYVDTYATEGVSLESVARHFHVSPNYLSALVRKETGKTYQQHVIEAKMRVAKQLLDDTRMHIEEISRAVGYENYISFYNMFRRMEGRTPSAYRMRNRGASGRPEENGEDSP